MSDFFEYIVYLIEPMEILQKRGSYLYIHLVNYGCAEPEMRSWFYKINKGKIMKIDYAAVGFALAGVIFALYIVNLAINEMFGWMF